MDRTILYPGAIPLAEDALSSQRYTQRALSSLLGAMFGSGSTVVDGFGCYPTNPASLAIIVGAGSIFTIAPADATAYSVLQPDQSQIMKQGDFFGNVNFNISTPSTPGQSITYLLQAAYQEFDDTPIALPYYNAASPSVSWSGPNNSGTAQNTVRRQRASVSLKAGAAANTGTQSAAAPDQGAVPLWTITVAYGQTTITSSNIALHPASPIIPYRLQQTPPGRLIGIKSFANPGTFTYSASPNAHYILVRIIGGGGGSAGSQNIGTGSYEVNATGGGGYGGVLTIRLYANFDGTPVTVGAGGSAGAIGGPGGNGGSSSFGAYGSASGGYGSPTGTIFNPANGSFIYIGGAGGGFFPSTNVQSNGNVFVPTKNGDSGASAIASANNLLSGAGASGQYGTGGPSVGTNGAVSSKSGLGGSGAGSGASGSTSITDGSASVSGAPGAAGQPGLVLIEEYTG